MSYIKWFIKLRFLALKNTLWKDKKAIMRTLSITAAIILGQILLTNILYKNIFSNIAISHELVNGMLIAFFFVAVIWIYLISFVQSISTFIRNFYKSPDMNYLITIPVPLNYVFLFKFFEHIISSVKSMLFLFFPFLAALGMWVNAPLIYFIMIIPLYIIISIIPCAIGVMVAMVGSRIVSVKVFNIITSIFTFAINVSFAVVFTRTQDISTTYILKLIDLLEKPWMSDIIPVTASVRLFYAMVIGGWSSYAGLFLLITSILFILIAFMVSKKLFFEGWAKNQFIETPDSKKKVIESSNFKDLKINETIQWIKIEWKMAIRNIEMLMASAFMLMFYLFSIFIFIYGGLFSTNPLIGISLLITIASIFNIIAVSILFIPADITKDKSLWKKRYWLLKVMPLEGGKVFNIQCNMFFIPAYIISIVGIIAYSVVNGLSIQLILLSILGMFFILYGSSAIYISGELLALTDFFENNAFIGNIITIVLPVLYGILSAGSIALFLAKDFVSDIIILSNISAIINLPIVIILSVTTVVATFLLSRTVFIRVWKQLEI
ncbi:putative ABC transporter permease subunit [Alkaliphilus serpentinus]|uniref:ABC-2 type transport system permease protein n=1 Tax=Alkaliphilus serpentinus TaxID=1482731 RepID=A0A833HLK7_9FIRM|nr:hypothetical protein [Alkaliphilus serpentinus]KAB3525928.1 hypothetical protein F8153_14445 [Alkaliphilus serpentinus]